MQNVQHNVVLPDVPPDELRKLKVKMRHRSPTETTPFENHLICEAANLCEGLLALKSQAILELELPMYFIATRKS